MIVAGSASPLLLSSAGSYNLTNSLRFRSSASAYLNRTPASAGNRRTWTWSGWVKRGTLGVTNRIFSADDGSASTDQDYNTLFFTSSDQIKFAGNLTDFRTTTAVYRDPSAWYHIVFACDTTQATAANRFKLYVNGVEVTAFGTSNNPSQNTDLAVNNNIAHYIGSIAPAGASYFDGYMDEINFIDGQALTPSSFGETSTTTGVWIPKKYTGTYGTNGFYLPFTNTTSTSTLGNDFSGNSNTWTVNNISLTSGSTYDSMTDVPTLTSATVSNYAVLNPLAMYGSNMLISNANLTSSATSTSNDRGWPSTIAAPGSGKWYAEFTFTSTNGDNNGGCGIMLENGTGVPGESATTVRWGDFGTLRQNASGTSYGSALVANDVVIVAYDAALGRVWFGKNGTWFASGDPATNANPSATGITSSGRFATYHYNTTAVIQANFGQRPFAYTPPTGFVRLNTFNLPTPTIGATASTTANKYFDATTYAGNNGTQSVTNSGSMQPDFVWVKNRTNAYTHLLYDVIRGVGTLKAISSSETTAEGGMSDNATFGYLSALNSNGFTVVSGSTANSYTNSSSNNYVGWQWKANGAGVSNTAGTITSTVSANTTAGFSIVTYTGTGANATVGHGLGVAPSMVIVKRRNGGSDNWQGYHISLGKDYTIKLNTTQAQENLSDYWGTGGVTSTVFGINGSYSGINANGGTYVAYCFAPVAGYSAFGSYTGNGSSDGTFIFTGFRPRYVLLKCSNEGALNWLIFDSSRDTYNVVTFALLANDPTAEVNTGGSMDFISNGFKLRDTNINRNKSGNTYIYMAFAENPFKYANAR